MVGFDQGESLAHRFRTHAGGQTHLYGYAMRGMADDIEAGGPTREVVRGFEDAPARSAVHLRLLAGIFRLVLLGRAPALEPYYPCLGGDRPPAEAWPVMRREIARHVADLHDALAVAPQTNEVGRSAALLVGLFDVARVSGCRQVRLLELGASAGLNLLIGRFRVTGDHWSWGPVSSPVRLLDAVQGPIVRVDVEIVEARGCDLDPVDATSQDGRLRLTSFVWPFDLHRHERLAAALEIAADHPPRVDRALASDWLRDRLAEDGAADPATLTVVWHSVTQQYWPAREIAAVTAVLGAYGGHRRLAEVGMEYDLDDSADDKLKVWTRLWGGDGTAPRHRVLGTAHDHGIPVLLSG